MWDYMKSRFTEISTLKGLIAIAGAILMYFTPDEVDRIIMFILASLGVTDILSLEKKSSK